MIDSSQVQLYTVCQPKGRSGLKVWSTPALVEG